MSAVWENGRSKFAGPGSTWRRILSPTGNTGDAIFRILMFLVALLMVGIVVAMVIALASDAMPSIRQFGFGFLKSQRWDPIKGEFGALPFVYGTVASSLIALLISVPFSLDDGPPPIDIPPEEQPKQLVPVVARNRAPVAPAPQVKHKDLDLKVFANCEQIGTNVLFVKEPPQAFLRAKDEKKMVFMVHLSGNLEDPGFT